MVGFSFNVVHSQHLGQLLYLFAAQTIYNAAACAALLDKLDYIAVNILGFRADFVVEVRTVERTLVGNGIGYAQTLFDVGSHLFGGSGSECNHGGITNVVDDGAYFAVFGTEVVTPFRDAMSLVNGIE